MHTKIKVSLEQQGDDWPQHWSVSRCQCEHDDPLLSSSSSHVLSTASHCLSPGNVTPSFSKSLSSSSRNASPSMSLDSNSWTASSRKPSFSQQIRHFIYTEGLHCYGMPRALSSVCLKSPIKVRRGNSDAGTIWTFS